MPDEYNLKNLDMHTPVLEVMKLFRALVRVVVDLPRVQMILADTMWIDLPDGRRFALTLTEVTTTLDLGVLEGRA